MIRRWHISVWLRNRCQPQPAPISSLSCTSWSEPQAGAITPRPPLPVPERQRSGASNRVPPSQTVNGGIKDGIGNTSHRPTPSHNSRFRAPHTDAPSVIHATGPAPARSRSAAQPRRIPKALGAPANYRFTARRRRPSQGLHLAHGLRRPSVQHPPEAQQFPVAVVERRARGRWKPRWGSNI
jgi:hypothetical protein